MANRAILVGFILYLLDLANSGPDCKDIGLYCASWAANGECQKNPGYMLEGCPDSCHQCSCGDNDVKCKSWAENGECALNPDYIKIHCRESCRLCRSVNHNDTTPSTTGQQVSSSNHGHPCIDDPANPDYDCPSLIEFYYIR